MRAILLVGFVSLTMAASAEYDVGHISDTSCSDEAFWARQPAVEMTADAAFPRVDVKLGWTDAGVCLRLFGVFFPLNRAEDVTKNDTFELKLKPDDAHAFSVMFDCRGRLAFASSAGSWKPLGVSVTTNAADRTWLTELFVPFAAMDVSAPSVGSRWGFGAVCTRRREGRIARSANEVIVFGGDAPSATRFSCGWTTFAPVDVTVANGDGWTVSVVPVDIGPYNRLQAVRVCGRADRARPLPRVGLAWELPCEDWRSLVRVPGFDGCSLESFAAADGKNRFAWGARSSASDMSVTGGLRDGGTNLCGRINFAPPSMGLRRTDFAFEVRFDWRKAPFDETLRTMCAWLRPEVRGNSRAADVARRLARGENILPRYPELGFPVIGEESSTARIWTVTSADVVCRVGAPDRWIVVRNQTGGSFVRVELGAVPREAVVCNGAGDVVVHQALARGVSQVDVPDGGTLSLTWNQSSRYADYDGTLIDNCWMWGHDTGVYDGPDMTYGIPVSEPITMAEAVRQMGVPNVCVIRWGDPPKVFEPQSPRLEYLAQFEGVKRFTWAIANNKDPVYGKMRKFVPGLLDRCPNMIGFDLDDFFRAHLLPDGIRTANGVEMSLLGALSVAELEELRAEMRAYGRPLDLRMTIYTKDVRPEIVPLARLADSVALWTWDGGDLTSLEKNFRKYRALLPDTPTLLGIYMWDFGGKKPLTVGQMEVQLMTALKLFRMGEIEGLVFHCTPLVNKHLEAVDYCRDWLTRFGKTRKANR